MAKAMISLEEHHSTIATRWKLHHNKETWYEDQKSGGLFIADVTFDVEGESVFHVEVSFSQTWNALSAKVKRILKLDNTLGVLAVNIIERPVWERRSEVSVPSDYIDKTHIWLPAVMASQESHSFGSLNVNGFTWANGVTVDVYYFSKGWENRDDSALVRYST
jgi:phosphatidylserine/phosphatidylglycerophosphate/cardiolipin synthase-like enzyme